MTTVLLSLMLAVAPAFADDAASADEATPAVATSADSIKGWHVSKTVAINAPAEIVWGIASDYNTWPEWTNWSRERDPEAKWTITGEPGQVGHSSSWDGPVLKTGSMTVVAVDGMGMSYDLQFGKSPKLNPGSITVTSTGEDTSSVTWQNAGAMGPIGRLLFRKSAEKAIGADFDIGLQKLSLRSQANFVASLKAEADAAKADAEAKASAAATAKAAAATAKTEADAAAAAVTSAEAAVAAAKRGKAKSAAEATLAEARGKSEAAAKASDEAAGAATSAEKAAVLSASRAESLAKRAAKAASR